MIIRHQRVCLHCLSGAREKMKIKSYARQDMRICQKLAFIVTFRTASTEKIIQYGAVHLKLKWIKFRG